MDNILSSYLSQLPTAFDATPSSLIEEAKTLINHTRTIWDEVALNIKPNHATFENTIVSFITDKNHTYTRLRLPRFYSSTLPSRDLRDASNCYLNVGKKQAFKQAQKQIQELITQCTSNLHEDSSGIWLPLKSLKAYPKRFWLSSSRARPTMSAKSG
ncbi:hypothetical protein GGI42DRAFT_364731 [Trichoderma sp. SZMC 28013]